ncbi:hypothetical protein BDV19DRAFT_372065 [Aspergillus venezuelensis]
MHSFPSWDKMVCYPRCLLVLIFCRRDARFCFGPVAAAAAAALFAFEDVGISSPCCSVFFISGWKQSVVSHGDKGSVDGSMERIQLYPFVLSIILFCYFD